MTTEQFVALFNDDNDTEYLQFDRVLDKFSRRPDLHALILLDRLCPTQLGAHHFPDIITSAEHHQIWLNFGAEDLAPLITEEQINELLRCGVSYDNDADSLTIYI